MEEEKKSPGVKRRRLFGAEDDKHLEEIISNKDFNGWKSVAKQMPGFSPKQLRDRWHNYISPKNKFGPWTEEEDQIIIQKVSQFGTKWSLIASFLKGRSDNCVKNRWNSVLRERVSAENIFLPIFPKEQKYIKPHIKVKKQSKANKKEVTPKLYLDPRFIEAFFEKCPSNSQNITKK